MRIEPVVLEGKHVRLEPINESHIDGLCQAILDGELWKLFVTIVPHPDDIEQFLNDAIKAQEMGDGLTFATIERSTGKIAGSTRFMKAELRYKRVEIGFTFLGQTWQKSPINTEAKFLMFSHAFDTLGLNRVELITDYLNTSSRRAVLRLGAKEEGILRNHMVMPDGRVRDSVLYSIIKNEWPGIKQHISGKLA